MFPDAGPTARAFLALELLQARPGATASELADRLGVSERAARRTVGTLRAAGIAVDSERGPYGGYRLGRGLRLPPLVFSATEALGLVMAVLDGAHAADDAGQPVGAALGKIIRALPENVGRQAALMRAHAAASENRAAVRPDPDRTAALVAAVAAGDRIEIDYRTDAGREWSERVDPWAVVVRYGRWYLLCHSWRVDAVRTYRVDRVFGVRATGERFEPPRDLDGVAVLEEHLGQGGEYAARVEFAAPEREVAPWVGPAMGRLVPLDEGRCLLEGTTSNPEMYAAEWLAEIPVPFKVEGGPELRGAMRALVARLAASVTDVEEAE